MITINGKEFSSSLPTTIRQLFAELKTDINQGIAIAVNNEVIPKKEWETRTVSDNDNIILIKATQGG